MHKTIATPEGGIHVELPEEECACMQAEWAKNEALALKEKEIRDLESALLSDVEIKKHSMRILVESDAKIVQSSKDALAKQLADIEIIEAKKAALHV